MDQVNLKIWYIGQGWWNRGEAGGRTLPPPSDFGRSDSPISTKGSKLCPPHYYSPPQIFRTCAILAGYLLYSKFGTWSPKHDFFSWKWCVPNEKSIKNSFFLQSIISVVRKGFHEMSGSQISGTLSLVKFQNLSPFFPNFHNLVFTNAKFRHLFLI